MTTVSRVCAFVVAAAGVVAARPAAAALTVVLRDGRGATVTYHNEGNRIRIENPTGDDPGEVGIVDLDTKRFLIVYPEVKAYFDFNKGLERARPLLEEAMKDTDPSQRPAAAGVSHRALGKTRTINGFSCAMYERVVADVVETEICFAPWGDAIGRPADFAWFDAYREHMTSQLGETGKRPATPHLSDKTLGLAVLTASPEAGGTRDHMEIVKITRGPLPPAMFIVPADYKEFSRPLTASEHVPRGSEPLDTSWQNAPRPSRKGISGIVALLIAVILIFGLLVHSIILHFAANLVLEHAMFTQALVAAIISWVALIAAELLHLPPVIGLGVCVFATFAALKIAYGASVPRTFALFALSALIAAAARYGAGSIGSLLGAG